MDLEALDQQQLFGWMDWRKSSELTVFSPALLSMISSSFMRSCSHAEAHSGVLGCPVFLSPDPFKSLYIPHYRRWVMVLGMALKSWVNYEPFCCSQVQ